MSTSTNTAPLSVPRGAVLYIGALLGPGLLLLPGLAAAKAGPASILAWVGLLIVSGLLAIVFAALGVALPSETGARAYADAGLGAGAGRAVGWCFLAGIITGAPIVCIIGGNYLAELLHRDSSFAAIGAAVLLALVVTVTLGGLRLSAGVQLGLVGVLIVVVAVAVAGAAGHSTARNWTPFAPHGWSALRSAASVLMLSFVGWEAIAPLTARFPHPRTQLPRVILIAFTATSVIYLALATVTVAALGAAAGTTVPLAALLRLGLGPAGTPIAAIAAVLLTLGTSNAYLSGAAALARSLTPARHPSSERHGDRLPGWLQIVISGSGAVLISVDASGRVEIAALVTVPTTFFLAVYLGCTTAAVRLLTGLSRVAAAAATIAVAVVLSFSGYALIPTAAVTLLAATTRRPNTAREKNDPRRP